MFAHSKREPSLLSARKSSARSSKRLKLGMPKEFFFDVVSEEVYAAFRNAVRAFQKQGATVKEYSIPDLNDTDAAANHIARPEATHYHQQAGWFPAHSPDYGEDVRSALERG